MLASVQSCRGFSGEILQFTISVSIDRENPDGYKILNRQLICDEHRSVGLMLKALSMTMKPQSFLLSAISASVGTALASLHGPVHWGYYLLTVLGVVLLHGGSNVINDYFDYRQRVDTTEVPGSYGNEARVLIQKILRPSQVLW